MMRPYVLMPLLMLNVVLAGQLPWPDSIFFAPDPQVGQVKEATLEELSARCAGKSALVVGGTDGIGRGIALTMAKAGASVTIVGHSPVKARETIGNLTAVALHPDRQKFLAYSEDLFTVKGILNFTDRLKSSDARFDYVALTVGIWPNPKSPTTKDGVDKVIALDVMARFLVTREILQSLNAGARVLSVLVSTVKFSPKLSDVKDIALGKKTDYGIKDILGAAGVMSDTWMQSMRSHYPDLNVTFIGTWPGLVATGLFGNSNVSMVPWWLKWLHVPSWMQSWAENLVMMSPEESGVIHTSILSSPNAGQRPVSYFNVKMEGRLTDPMVYDASFQQWVWSFLQDTISQHNITLQKDHEGTRSEHLQPEIIRMPQDIIV